MNLGELEQATIKAVDRIRMESEKRKRQIAEKVEKLKEEVAEEARRQGRGASISLRA